MEQDTNQKFLGVTLLITHFNRSESLKRLLETLDRINISFEELIVSDGGSRKEHLDHVLELKEQFKFTLLTSAENKGLGNTINMGQDAVKTPYILYIQEDFVPKPAFVNAFKDGLAIMKEEQKWDLVRFYSFPWSPYPYLKEYKKGFATMGFSLLPWYTSHLKFHIYSDHPHLKRRSFPEKFGRYFEARNGDVTEMNMCRTFLKKNGQALYFRNFKALFEHDNPEDEPGLFRPDKVKSKNYADIKPLYWVYLKYKLVKDTLAYVFNTKI
jgi:glycosyltransferase involved in cell wall biosynthesis